MTLSKILLAGIIITASVITGCKKEKYINEPGNLVPKTVDEDPSLPQIYVNGCQLHSEAFGHPDSSIIVVIHGGPGSDYRSLLKCKEFADHGFRVVFYDQAGSGLSQRFPKAYYKSTQLVFDELSGVIANYKTHTSQKVFLLGHSWGAILASGFVNQRPNDISGIVLAEPGGLIWKDIIDYVDRSRSIKLTKELLNDETYTDQFLTGKESEHQVLDYKYGILSSADGNKDNPTGNESSLPFWRFGAITNIALFEVAKREEPDWTSNLSRYNPKVLFIYSENNKAYGVEWAAKISSAFPNVELYKANGAGHDMFSFETGWANTFPKMLHYFKSF